MTPLCHCALFVAVLLCVFVSSGSAQVTPIIVLAQSNSSTCDFGTNLQNLGSLLFAASGQCLSALVPNIGNVFVWFQHNAANNSLHYKFACTDITCASCVLDSYAAYDTCVDPGGFPGIYAKAWLVDTTKSWSSQYYTQRNNATLSSCASANGTTSVAISSGVCLQEPHDREFIAVGALSNSAAWKYAVVRNCTTNACHACASSALYTSTEDCVRANEINEFFSLAGSGSATTAPPSPTTASPPPPPPPGSAATAAASIVALVLLVTLALLF